MADTTLSYSDLLHVCLLRNHHLPIELRVLIFEFAKYPCKLRDFSIENAVRLYIKRVPAIFMYGPIEWWDTSEVTNMYGLFCHYEDFNADISRWDVSNVTNMTLMFSHARSFNQPIGRWNTSKVTSMGYMFNQAKSFNQPIGDWNVSQVLYTYSMFENASAFNQPLNKWKAPEIKSTLNMFDDAEAFDVSCYNPDFYEEDRFKMKIITNTPISISYPKIKRIAYSFETQF